MKKIILFLILMAFPPPASAEFEAGKIVNLTGDVRISRSGSVESQKAMIRDESLLRINSNFSFRYP